MAREIIGKVLSSGADHYAIVVSRYHSEITQKLLDGAVGTLERHGVPADQISVAWAPGAFEIPVIANGFAKTKKYAAVIGLGAVIQGETDHHDHINHAVAQGFVSISVSTEVPVLFGVLTCHNMDQARDRAGGKVGNKGAEAALAALEAVSVLNQIA